MEFCGVWFVQDQRDVCDADMVLKKCASQCRVFCSDGILLDVATDKSAACFHDEENSAA